MIRHEKTARLGIESLEARDCPGGLTGGFSWGEFSGGEFSWRTTSVAQTNPSNDGPTSIPTDQFSVALTPARG